MPTTITAADLEAVLRGDGELALIDVREEGVFGQNHLLMAVNLPLSGLELSIRRAVPRRGTPLVLVDDDDGLAARAAALLTGFGYVDISLLEGGVAGWTAAGLETFSGLNVPSKAFGEYVEHHFNTPSVDATELRRMIDNGADMVILDSRPMAEFNRMSIPGGINCPGAELTHRIAALAPNPETTVVVNCAGRTRSILGAQSLRHAGVPNPVVALRNGTMGWHLAGFKLDHGQDRAAPAVSAADAVLARDRAGVVAAHYGVPVIDGATLQKWRGEQETHTLLVLDVRGPDEYQAGHLVDARHAPGGQVVQATDRHIAVRNARVVLVDPAETRALMTAAWLIQMGLSNVHVLAAADAATSLVTGPEAIETPPPPAADTLTPEDLNAALTAGAVTVVDLQPSLAYREGHIPGAWFLVRARWQADLAALGAAAGKLVVTSPDGALALWAAAEMTAAGRPANALAGGTEAWAAAGYPLTQGMENPASLTDDVFLLPYARRDPDEAAAAMNAYLTWEVALLDQIKKPGGISFPQF